MDAYFGKRMMVAFGRGRLLVLFLDPCDGYVFSFVINL